MTDSPDADLVAIVAVVAAGTRRVVRSYLGLSLTVYAHSVLDGSVVGASQAVNLTLLDGAGTDPDAIRTSARLRLSMAPDPDTGIFTIVFYAGRPGAFVDYAANLCVTVGLPLDAIMQDLSPAPTRSRLTGLTEISLRNQAVGRLLERGLTPEVAIRELALD